MKIYICEDCGNISEFVEIYNDAQVRIKLYGELYDIDDVNLGDVSLIKCAKCGGFNVAVYEYTIRGFAEKISLSYLSSLSSDARMEVVKRYYEDGKLRRVSQLSSALGRKPRLFRKR